MWEKKNLIRMSSWEKEKKKKQLEAVGRDNYLKDIHNKRKGKDIVAG